MELLHTGESILRLNTCFCSAFETVDTICLWTDLAVLPTIIFSFCACFGGLTTILVILVWFAGLIAT